MMCGAKFSRRKNTIITEVKKMSLSYDLSAAKLPYEERAYYVKISAEDDKGRSVEITVNRALRGLFTWDRHSLCYRQDTGTLQYSLPATDAGMKRELREKYENRYSEELAFERHAAKPQPPDAEIFAQQDSCFAVYRVNPDADNGDYEAADYYHQDGKVNWTANRDCYIRAYVSGTSQVQEVADIMKEMTRDYGSADVPRAIHELFEYYTPVDSPIRHIGEEDVVVIKSRAKLSAYIFKGHEFRKLKTFTGLESEPSAKVPAKPPRKRSEPER
jgi:hypothetical protein